MLIDNGWFSTLRRDDVELVTEPIDHVVPEGFVTADGELHPLDTVVLATGSMPWSFWDRSTSRAGAVGA